MRLVILATEPGQMWSLQATFENRQKAMAWELLRILTESQEASLSDITDCSQKKEGPQDFERQRPFIMGGRALWPCGVGLKPKGAPLLTPGLCLGLRDVREESQLDIPNHQMPLADAYSAKWLAELVPGRKLSFGPEL